MNTENLKPVRTVEEARELGRRGGIASGVARKEKRLLSDALAEVLNELYLEDEEHGTGLKDTVKKIIKKADSSSVSMLKVIAESTEGSKVNLSGSVDTNTVININGVKTEG